MTSRVLKFNYTDKKGVRKENRCAWVICPASEKHFAIDLTEFDPEEREELIILLDNAYKNFLDEIKELGLSGNYRLFFKDKVEVIQDSGD